MKYRAILRWCTVHRQTVASTSGARRPYCRRGIHLREECYAVYARIEWEDGEDGVESLGMEDLGELGS